MEEINVKLTAEQRNNLLVMLDSVQIKGIRSAHEYLIIVRKIQDAKPDVKEIKVSLDSIEER